MKVSKAKLISVLVGTFLLMMSSAVVSNSTTYFITSVTSVLNCTRAEFSLYYTILQFCTVIVSLLMGSLLQRLPLRLIFLAGCIGTGAGFVIMSNLQGLMMVYVGAAVIGIFQACIVVPVVSVVNSWFHENNGLAIGVTMSATGFGGIMMAQIMPRVVSGMSWRTGYLVCAVLFVVISGIALFLAGGKAPEYEDETEGSKDAGGQNIKQDDSYKKVISSPMFWMFFIFVWIGDGCNMIAQHLSAHLEAQSLSITMIAAIMSVFSIALAIFKILEGYLYDKVGSKIFIPVLFIVSVAGYFALTLTSQAGLILGVIFFGVGASTVTAVYPLVLREVYGAKLSSALWGFCWAAIACGNSTFTPIFGAIYDATGSYNDGFYMAAIGTALVGIFFVFRLAQMRKARAKEAALAQ